MEGGGGGGDGDRMGPLGNETVGDEVANGHCLVIIFMNRALLMMTTSPLGSYCSLKDIKDSHFPLTF